MPTIRGRANSRMADTPIKYNTNTIMKVVSDVLMLLVTVWVMLLFTSSSRVSLFLPAARFSRIRSKITMVALMEYPTIVSIHAIKVDPTDHLATA